MSTEKQWQEIILDSKNADEAWSKIFDLLKDCAIKTASPVELHKQTIPADRLLAESAWSLWDAYGSSAPRTSNALISWSNETSQTGKAILVLDALSMSELPLILGGAQSRNITLTNVGITGAEIPSDTDRFAHALGVSSRSSLQDNKASSGFKIFDKNRYTDVFGHPFADCCGSIPPEKNIFIWHTWLDDMIHVYRKTPDQIHSTSVEVLQSDGFWEFIDCLRQGRNLIITGDHGYTNSRLFSNEESNPENIEAFRNVFCASRYVPAKEVWNHSFMPPCVLSTKDHHVIVGQKKWKVQGGFPALCHGGLSLLEVAVPFIEFKAL